MVVQRPTRTATSVRVSPQNCVQLYPLWIQNPQFLHRSVYNCTHSGYRTPSFSTEVCTMVPTFFCPPSGTRVCRVFGRGHICPGSLARGRNPRSIPVRSQATTGVSPPGILPRRTEVVSRMHHRRAGPIPGRSRLHGNGKSIEPRLPFPRSSFQPRAGEL